MKRILEVTAKRLGELGNPVRLNIYRMLVKSGKDGMSVGKIKEKLDIPSSTLSHHITRLVSVELISQERQGNVLICKPIYENLDCVIKFLKSECCG